MPLCLEYPAHTIAAGCLYLASKLCQHDDPTFRGLDKNQSWGKLFLSRLEDVKGKCMRACTYAKVFVLISYLYFLDVGRKILDFYMSKPNEFGPSINYMQIKIQLNEETIPPDTTGDTAVTATSETTVTTTTTDINDEGKKNPTKNGLPPPPPPRNKYDDPLMNEQTRLDDQWAPSQLPSYNVDLLLNTNTHTVSYTF